MEAIMKLRQRGAFSLPGALLALIALLALGLAALACSLQGGEDLSLRQTDIAIGIQQTLIAQTATALQAGLVAQPATQPAGETPTSPPQISEPPPPSPTEAATQPPLPTDTPLAATTVPVPEAVPIEDWGTRLWAALNSGCLVKDAQCWKMDDDYKKHLGAYDLVLISKQPVLIDPSWPNPYLVFWHKYDLKRLASVDLQIGGQWVTFLRLTNKSSGGRWIQEAIKLSDYKGKEIIVRFSAQGIWGSGGIAGSDWFVNNVILVPDYVPNP
jgi:hypothetical protein